MSRPRKNADQRRTRHITFRLTEEEYEAMRLRAESAGLAPGEFARRLACADRASLDLPAYRPCDPAFIKRLDHIGMTLAEIFKNAEAQGRPSPRLEMLCHTIEQVVTEGMEGIGDGP